MISSVVVHCVSFRCVFYTDVCPFNMTKNTKKEQGWTGKRHQYDAKTDACSDCNGHWSHNETLAFSVRNIFYSQTTKYAMG